MPPKTKTDIPPPADEPAAVNATELETAAEETPVALPPGRYRFLWRDTTIYPVHGVVAEPESVHDWPDGPPNDGRWVPADKE